MYFSIAPKRKKKDGLGRPRKAQDRDHHPYSRNKMLHTETEDIRRPPLIPYGDALYKRVGMKQAQFIQLNTGILRR